MQPVSAPSSVQLLDDADAVLFTLADGSRHVARLIPSARARKLRLRLSPGRGLLLTVPAGMPARALPALLFSFLPWLERHLPACPAPAPPVVPESLLLPLRGTALRVVAAGPLAEGRRQSPSCAEPPLLLRSPARLLSPFTIFAEYHGFGFFLRMEIRSAVILGSGSKDSGRAGWDSSRNAGTACKM